jgi:hypothetical protein
MTCVCGCCLFRAAGVHQGQIQDWRLNVSARQALAATAGFNRAPSALAAPGWQGAGSNGLTGSRSKAGSSSWLSYLHD